jgi:hypothetical protein
MIYVLPIGTTVYPLGTLQYISKQLTREVTLRSDRLVPVCEYPEFYYHKFDDCEFDGCYGFYYKASDIFLLL